MIHQDLVIFAIMAQARLDAVDALGWREVYKLQQEAEAMTDEEIRLMVAEELGEKPRNGLRIV